MKKQILIFIISLIISGVGISQEPACEVNKVYPSISLTKQALEEAETLGDLNKYYKSSWIREYISVEVQTSHDGKVKSSLSKEEQLSPEQKESMKMADVGTEVSVKVLYMPENNLKHNEVKEMDFAFTIDPDNEASFPGGSKALQSYLEENALAKIPVGSFEGYDLTAVKFTINELGEIVDAHIFGAEYQPSKNEDIDQLLLEVIRKMPCWTPAAYADGTKTRQEMVLTVGNLENCVVPMLNIRREDNAKKD